MLRTQAKYYLTGPGSWVGHSDSKAMLFLDMPLNEVRQAAPSQQLDSGRTITPWLRM